MGGYGKNTANKAMKGMVGRQVQVTAFLIDKNCCRFRDFSYKCKVLLQKGNFHSFFRAFPMSAVS